MNQLLFKIEVIDSLGRNCAFVRVRVYARLCVLVCVCVYLYVCVFVLHSSSAQDSLNCEFKQIAHDDSPSR